MKRRNYDVDSQEYQQMATNQRLFLLVLLFVLLLVAVGAFIGLSWYFFGEIGGKVALGGVVLVIVLLTGWFMVMASINSVSNIYRDAAMTIVEFQAADDRGEVMRHMATAMKAERGLDKSVLSLAANLARGQAKALTDSHQVQQRQAEQNAIESEWWNVPDSFEVDLD